MSLHDQYAADQSRQSRQSRRIQVGQVPSGISAPATWSVERLKFALELIATGELSSTQQAKIAAAALKR